MIEDGIPRELPSWASLDMGTPRFYQEFYNIHYRDEPTALENIKKRFACSSGKCQTAF